MTPKLTLDDLAKGLLQYSGTYFALDVFATDVAELADEATIERSELEPKSDGTFGFARDGKPFELQLFRDLGVARVTLAGTASGSTPTPVVTGAAGAALGAALSDRDRVGGAAIGFLAGLLVGAALGSSAPTAPRRVFALMFDPESREWRTYDGGLVRWVKEQLAPPEVVGDLPVAKSA